MMDTKQEIGALNEKPEPRRSKYLMVDTEPDAEAADNRPPGCLICKGAHALSKCPVIVSKNISFPALRKMPMEARREYLKSLGLGQYLQGSSTRGADVTEHKENATERGNVSVDHAKTKAGGIEEESAQSCSLGCVVKKRLCLVCEKSDHPTGACPYRVRIPRGEKISCKTHILCECCNEVGAHAEDEDWVEYYAELKFCGFCFAMASHSVENPEDCPNKEGQERLNKIHDETLKKMKKDTEEWQRKNPLATRMNVF